MHVLSYIRLLLFFTIAISILYFGIGGFIYLELVQEKERIEESPISDTTSYKFEKITIKGKDNLRVLEQLSLTERIFPSVIQMPSFLNYIITAMAFGAFGSFGFVINSAIKNGLNLRSNKNLFIYLINGGFAGVIVLAISYTVPFLLTAEAVTLKPTTVVFFCLFAGFLHIKFFDWFDSIFDKKIFKKED
jgi:hypothetical protein